MKLLILLGLVLPAMSRKIGSFVVGGSDASIANFPHQLSFRFDGRHNCGASLISQTRAVTAAHCIAGRPVEGFSLLGGASYRQDTNGSTSVLFNVTKIVVHPKFINSGLFAFPNDIAILEFEPVKYNINFQPIELASESDGDFAGEECVITGWGQTNGTNTTLPNVLQEAKMIVLTEDDCRQKVSPFINGGHICVAAPTSSGCMGDSGGPLVCRNKLVGATSFGNGRCDPDLGPSMYARVTYFLDFIASA